MSAEDCAVLSENQRPGLVADSPLIDFSPVRLRDNVGLREVAQVLITSGLWGVPVVDEGDDYVGICTLRSLTACTLPATLRDDAAGGAARGITPLSHGRLSGALDRSIRQVLDLQVPAIRISTGVPQLLAALCRRSPVIPIVSDIGMRLLGVASLERAVRALYGEQAL